MLAVNGVDVGGKSAFEVSSLLQGPNDTFVTIKVVILIVFYKVALIFFVVLSS